MAAVFGSVSRVRLTPSTLTVVEPLTVTVPATLLVNSNVAHVLYRREYRDQTGVELLHRAGIDTRPYDDLAAQFRDPLPEDPKA